MVISPGTQGIDFNYGVGVFPDAQGRVWYASCRRYIFLGLFGAEHMCDIVLHDSGHKMLILRKYRFGPTFTA